MNQVVCPHDGCSLTFATKRGRKEHVFQIHSSPKIVFLGRQELVEIPRHDDGYLYCPCTDYKVRTVGAFKRHAKKCTGFPVLVPLEPVIELPNRCTAEGCSRSFNTKNALAVHVYEYHSNPKAVFVDQTAMVIERDQGRYLHCPCGAYSVLTTAAMLRHAKTCDGIPRPNSETESVRRATGKHSPKKRRLSSVRVPQPTLTANDFEKLTEAEEASVNTEDTITISDTSFYNLLNLDFDS